MNEEEIRKKTIFIIVLVITYILLLSNSIYAFNADDNTWVGCPIKKENEGDKIKFTLERDAIEKDGDNAGIDLEVKAGQIVILDGHKLQNYSEGCSTINIFPGGNLTIVDNSGGKQGEILQKNGSTGLSTIYNAGTLNIEAGKITQTEQVNNIAVINNASNAELNIKRDIRKN